MSSLNLPSRRVGWSINPERPSATDDHALHDTLRALRAVMESLMPRDGAHLPRAVAQTLCATQAQLVQADAASFNAALAELRVSLAKPKWTAETTGRALGLVGAAMARTVGKAPYDTQYLAAWLILQGRLAEMATGEGKTLAAALAGAVAALGQVPVHMLTANDYLVQRDSETLAPFYAALGVKVGCVLAPMTREQRAPAYRCDITFVTPKELVFDYLKDHLAQEGEHDPRVLRARELRTSLAHLHSPHAPSLQEPGAMGPLIQGLHMAIVDEADACLLDEAVTPLILAQPGRAVDANAYACAFSIAEKLQRGRDYRLMPSARAARLSPSGRAEVDRGVRAAGAAAATLAPPQRACELAEAALAARWLFRRDRDYAVTAEGIQLIDEVTGRIATGRQWSGALQQMIEIKEGVALSSPTVPAAQITFQRFFPRYLHLGGMSGTLTEARRELRRLYDVGVVAVPLARASRRRWLGEELYANAAAKWSAVVEHVAVLRRSGRPVLVGTDSVADSAHLCTLLSRSGIACQVLNAVQDAHEAQCIAQAGRSGTVTVATNMAGRGTDIELDEPARAAGGLHVIACMRNSARRIDRQLMGRCARHGDPGSAQRVLALDDVLLQTGLPAWLLRVATRGARGGRIPRVWATPLLAIAQRTSEWQQAQRRKLLRLTERQLGDLYGHFGVIE